MLATHFRIILAIGVALYFALILNFIRKGRMSLKYSLMWLLTGLVMLVFAISPQLAAGLAHVLGIYSDANTIFFVGIAFVVIIVMSLTVIVTGQTERIRNLTSSQALLEKRIRELETKERMHNINENGEETDE